MPNVGKPSKGCQPCRKRKVKVRADAKGSQAKELTLGYAKLDPTSASGPVEQHVNDVESGSNLCTDADTVALRPQDPAGSTYPTPESMVAMEILPSIDEHALGFFISNHVSPPALVPRGQYECTEGAHLR